MEKGHVTPTFLGVSSKTVKEAEVKFDAHVSIETCRTLSRKYY